MNKNSVSPCPALNGNTKIFGVIGDPVRHSFSPQIHRHFTALCGYDMAYVPFPVHADGLADAPRGAHALHLCGLNVTVPHKRAVIPLLAWVDPAAEQIGAVNTLVRWENAYAGYNTDYSGIIKTIATLGYSFKDKSVTVLGAGGSAYAACSAAAAQGAARITIINRTLENAALLARHVNKYYNIPIDMYSFEKLPPPEYRTIMLQTTAAELKTPATTAQPAAESASVPVFSRAIQAADFFEGVAVAFDFVYTPWETDFLKQARKAAALGIAPGLQAINGFPMLVYQAAASFAIWQRHFFNDAADKEDLLSSRTSLETLTAQYRALP